MSTATTVVPLAGSHPGSRRDPWWRADDDRRTPAQVLADLQDALGLTPRPALLRPAPDPEPRVVRGPDGYEED